MPGELIPVEVLERDIASGKRMNPRFCAFALAAARALGAPPGRVSSGTHQADLYSEDPLVMTATDQKLRTFDLMDDARQFVRAFDDERDVQPGTYHIRESYAPVRMVGSS